jgi:IS66 C-terminal element
MPSSAHSPDHQRAVWFISSLDANYTFSRGYVTNPKLNGIDPEAYLRAIITRIADHPAKRIGELLPWNITL